MADEAQGRTGASVFEKTVRAMSPAKAVPAMKLDHVARTFCIGISREGLCCMQGQLQIRSLLICCTGRPVNRRPRLLNLNHHIGKAMLIRLKRANWTPELNTFFGISDRSVERLLRPAQSFSRKPKPTSFTGRGPPRDPPPHHRTPWPPEACATPTSTRRPCARRPAPPC